MRETRRTFLLQSLTIGSAIKRKSPPGFPEVLASAPKFEDIHKIDIHSHIFGNLPALASMMRRNNIRIINVCNRGNDPELLKMQDRTVQFLFRTYGGSLFPFASSFDLSRHGEADYVDHVIAWLKRNFQAGAVMVKIWKEVGMSLKKADGTFLMPDDPIFYPIFEFLASQKKPLLAHLADPTAAWQPLNPESVHYGYYSRNPEWHFYGKAQFPTHTEIMVARDRILEKHPNLQVIGAHMGSFSHDVNEVARLLDRYPNFYVECSARTADLSRQPRHKVRTFFQKYAHRILYGLDRTLRLDSGASRQEREAFVNNLEMRYRLDYHFYAGMGTLEYQGKKVQALTLPSETLNLFYHGNAQRMMALSGKN